jgi:hypothetical protein
MAFHVVRHRSRDCGNAPAGYDVQLTQYDERGWRATFYVTGMEHSATSSTATASDPTPWGAARLGMPWGSVGRGAGRALDALGQHNG